MKSIIYEGEKLNVITSKYSCNNRLYLGLECEDGEPYADITINLDGYDILPDCVFLNGDLPTDLKDELYKQGILENKLGTLPYNYGTYDLAEVSWDILEGVTL